MNRRISPQAILRTVEERATVLLLVGVGVMTAAWVVVCFWKYAHFLYNALDLAIFSHVVWNTSQGRWFEMTIHPQSYLGDHFEPYLLLLGALYRLWTDPRILLVTQAIVVNAAAIPLFFLARNIFRKTQAIAYPRAVALVVALCYLGNSLVANTIIFEFHVLPFFLLPFFFALLEAERGRFWRSMAFLLLTLLAREDASFHVALFGVAVVVLFPHLRQKKWRWIFVPGISAALWFALGATIISNFSPTHDYKYVGFYTELHGGLASTLWGLVTNPWPLLARLLRSGHLMTAGGLLMSVGFVAVFAPAALIIGLVPLLQYAVTESSSAQVLILHYGIAFVPMLMLGAIFGIRRAAQVKATWPLTVRLGWPPRWPMHLAVLFLIAGTLYSNATLGQPWKLDRDRGIGSSGGEKTEAALKRAVNDVEQLDSIVVPIGMIAQVAEREHLYPIGYVRRGTQQLSEDPYVISTPVQALVLDQYDLGQARAWLNAEVQNIPLADSAKRVRELIEKNDLATVWSQDGIALLRPRALAPKTIPLTSNHKSEEHKGTRVADGLALEATVTQQTDEYTLATAFSVAAKQPNWLLRIEELDEKENVVADYRFHPGWGITATDEWLPGETIESIFPMRKTEGLTKLRLSLEPANRDAKKPEATRSIILPL